MRIEIFNWAGERKTREAIEALGFEHRQIIDGDVFEVAKKFVDRGLNIMIMRGAVGICNYVLCIDTQSFGQR